MGPVASKESPRGVARRHNGQNDPMGRPTKLTPELRVDLERQLADGVPVAVVAQGCRSNGRAARVGVCPRLSLRP
jgi:hypothetical protein